MAADSPIQKVGKGSAFIIAGFVIGALFQYLIQIVLARTLGPNDYGVFVQSLAIAQTVATISLLGIHKGVPRFISKFEGENDPESIRKTLSTAFYIALTTASTASIALFLLSGSISNLMSEPLLGELLKIFSLTILPLSLIYLLISFFRGFQNARTKVLIDDFVFSGLVLFVSSTIVLFGKGLSHVAYGYLLAEILTIALAFALFRSKYRFDILALTGGMTGKLLSFSWPLLLISIFLMVNKWSGIWILGYFRESAQVGIYNASYSLAGAIFLVLNALNYMFLPAASELYGEGRIGYVNELFANSTRWIVMAAFPIFAGMLIFPEAILELFFSSVYAKNPLILQILALGFFVASATGPAGNVLLAAGRTRTKMAGIATISLTMVLLGIVLTPSMGAIGTAVATTTGLILGNLFLLLFAFRELGTLPYNSDYLRLAPALLITPTTVYLLKNLLKPGVLLSVGLGSVFMAVYLCLIYAADGFRDEEKELVQDFLHLLKRYL